MLHIYIASFQTFRLLVGRVVGHSIIFGLLDILIIFFGFGLRTHSKYYEIATPFSRICLRRILFNLKKPLYTILKNMAQKLIKKVLKAFSIQIETTKM